MAWLATFFPRTPRNSPADVAAKETRIVGQSRISGDLPELHLDLQINHEAGKALVVLVADGRTWCCFRIIAKRDHSQP